MIRQSRFITWGASLTAALTGAVVFATAALAQSPTAAQYGDTFRNVAGGDPGDPQLPFTGLDAVAFAVIGLALVGTGLLVRHLARGSKPREFRS